MRRTKIVAAMLSLVFVFMLFPSLKVNAAVVDSGYFGENDSFYWSLDDSGKLTVTGNGDMPDFNSGGAPWFDICDNITSIEISQGVTSIGNWAFYLCQKATSVTIPDTVTSIGKDAFYICTKLNNVTLPASVNTIGESAFASCYDLSIITIEGTITTLGVDAFSYSGITNIPSRLITSTIPDGTFSGCKFTTITIPNTVTSIGYGAFEDCTSLTSITIPNSVTSIGYNAFKNCEKLQTTNNSISIDKALYDKYDDAFPDILLTSFNFTEYTITYATASNGTVTGTTTTSVSGETIIPTVSPNSGYVVKEVTYTNIENTPVPITPDASGNYAFTMPSCNTTVSATFILGGNCGKNGDNLKWTYDDATKTLTITGSGDMANYAYGGAAPWFGIRDNITSIVISDGVTSIGNWSFYLCQNATSVTIANTVTSIGDEAFYYCKKLNNVNLPASVNTIGTSAFESCSALSNITINGTITSLGVDTFNGAALTDIPGGLITSTIPEGTFYGCGFTTITIPNTVTSIGNGAFENCYQLTSITIPNSVTSIGGDAFDDCYSLTSITIPNSVTSIGDYAFRNCKNLTSVTIPNSITSIGDNPFFFCDKLKTTDNSISIDKAFYDSNKDAFPDIPLTSFSFTKYAITYTSDGNGTVSGADESASTDKITLTITPNANYVIDTVTYTDNGTEKTINKDANGNYSFEMPVGATTVNATFKLADYEIKFVNTDGTELQSGPVTYGNTPTYTGATPTKAADAQYTYTFSGWTPTIAPATADATYTATYSTTTNEYTVTFTDADGNQLQSGKVAYGTVPAYSGTPTKAETDKYTYTFAGWKSGNSTYGVSSTLPKVTGDVTYTAVFTETAKPTTTPAPVAKPGTYYLSSMVEQDGNIVVTIKMSEDDTKTFDLLGTVTSDGVALTEGNQYTAAKGSAIITINKSFLDTLAAGNHKLTVTFTDGGSITIDYEVKAPAAAPQTTAKAVQATGEAVSAASIAGACLILAAAGIAFTVTRKRKEEA